MHRSQMIDKKLERALHIIDNILKECTGKELEERDRTILSDSLAGKTYQEMQATDPMLRGVSVEYISRYLAYNLWNKLTLVLQEKNIITRQENVIKSKVWYIVDKIEQWHNLDQANSLLELPPKLIEGKILRGRYQISEYLYNRDQIERHFRAVDSGSKPCLVIQLCNQSELLKTRFYREAEILSKLSEHPQIHQLLDYFEDDRCLYLIYEYAEGEPLTNKLIAGRPWQESEVKTFLHNTLSVLDFVHQHNIIHCNLNPDSLIQKPDGSVLLTDFATIKEIGYSGNSSVSQNSFARGMKGYMPGEQLMGIAKETSDIYAIGKIAIYALTGIPPCKLKVNPNTINPVWRRHTQVSSSLGDAIDRMVCHNFQERFQSAAEVLAVIEGSCDEVQPVAETPTVQSIQRLIF